jgi:8-oxo-dGTP pyrophosphatase MutT (NUDIX family)
MHHELPRNATNVFKGVLMDVWQWDQERYDGTHATYECAIRPDSAHVIAFRDPTTVMLTRQEQPGRAHPFIDIPGGRLDRGESPEDGARREFFEETGLRIGRLLPWKTITLSGATRFTLHYFLATDLMNHAKGKHVDAGEKVKLMPTPWNRAVKLALEQKMRQAWVMLAILSLEYDPSSKKRLRDFLSGRKRGLVS